MPAEPALAFTNKKAFITCCFGMINGSIVSNGVLLLPVALSAQSLNPTPLTQFHYRTFLAHNGWSVPVPCIDASFMQL
jgi:hypothetical protein